jgi:lipoate synthase
MKEKKRANAKVGNTNKTWRKPKIETMSTETARPNFMSCDKQSWAACLSWTTAVT